MFICTVAGANRLQDAMSTLHDAVREVEAALDEMRAEHDPLAVHIFISRRNYRKIADTKSRKRSGMSARLSWDAACALGFRGSLGEWERLMGAVAKR
jgi:hypothetical protein